MKRQYSKKAVKRITKSQFRIYLLNTDRAEFKCNFTNCPLACYIEDTYEIVSPVWVFLEGIELTLNATEETKGSLLQSYQGKTTRVVFQELPTSKWQRDFMKALGAKYGEKVTREEALRLMM